MLSVDIVNVVLLGVVMMNVVMLSVMEPWTQSYSGTLMDSSSNASLVFNRFSIETNQSIQFLYQIIPSKHSEENNSFKRN